MIFFLKKKINTRNHNKLVMTSSTTGMAIRKRNKKNSEKKEMKSLP